MNKNAPSSGANRRNSDKAPIGMEKPRQVTLLLVDDSPDLLAVLTDFLRPTRWRLVLATDGQEGYQKATVLQPDLILLDVWMPRVDGFAAVRLLKADARTRDIPVIFLSGAKEVEERLTGLRLGAVDYISKPFSPEEVLVRINIHLDLHRRRSEQRAAGEAQGPPPGGRISTTVSAAMAVLRQDIRQAPSLTALAHQVGTNERRLNLLFRNETGTTVFAWLREQRFLLACKLLAETALEIQQISDQVGYGNAANFTTMFKERFGVTPGEYRHTCQQRDREQR